MANSFFVPFNHQPDSISFHTSPVTLGSDEYARLLVLPPTEIDDSVPSGRVNITLDGTIVVPQTIFASQDWDSGEECQIDANGKLFLTYDGGSATQLYVDIEVNNSAIFNIPFPGVTGYHEFPVSAGDKIRMSGGTTNRTVKGFLLPTEPVQTEFWLPPSTAISSSDGTNVRRFMLERYNLYS